MGRIIRNIKKVKQFISDFKQYRKHRGIYTCNVSYYIDKKRFENVRVVLISGGNSGIGLATARMFLQEGAKVIIAARNQSKLDDIIKGENNSNLSAIQLDVSDISSISMMLLKASDIFGDINIFVNCAGVYETPEDCKTISDQYDYIMNINHKGMYGANLAECEYLRKRNIRGKIINISSVAGERYLCDPYTLSKWGVNVITKALALQMAEYGICINAVAPGNVPTNISQWHRDIDRNNIYTEQHRTHRLVLPEEVANLILYLASDSANSIIGQIIGIDGGFVK